MEHLALIALALITNVQNQESRSALPDAPVVDDGRGPRVPRLASTRGWLADALHRAAWALEPSTSRCPSPALAAATTAPS